MGNGSLFYFYRCKKQTVNVKCQNGKCQSVNCQSVNCQSVNCQSVNCQCQLSKCQVSKCQLSMSTVNVNCQSVNCQSVNCQNGKCQKNGFDSLTVADGQTRKKKQGNTWFFRNYHIVPMSTVKVSTTVKMGV